MKHLLYLLIFTQSFFNANTEEVLVQPGNCKNEEIFFSLYSKNNVIINEDFIITEKGKFSYLDEVTSVNEYDHNILIGRKNVGRYFYDDNFEKKSAVISNSNKYITKSIGCKESINLVAIKKNELCNEIESFLKKNLVITNSAKILNNKAFFLMNNGYYQGSIKLYTFVLQKFPTSAVAYLNIGDAYWFLKQEKEAKENYIEYIKLFEAQRKDLKKVPPYVLERIKK